MRQHGEGEPNIETIMLGILDEVLQYIHEKGRQFFLNELAKIVLYIDKYEGQIKSQYESIRNEAQNWMEFRSELSGMCQELGDRTGIVMDPGTTAFNNLINRIIELPPKDRKIFIKSIINRIDPSPGEMPSVKK